MLRRADLPHPLPLGPFRFGDARAAGVTRDRLRAADIQHPHHGLYVAGPSREGVVAAGELLLPLLADHHRFSHLSAARLWGFPLPFEWTRDEPLHVMAMADAAPMRRPQVIGWETEASDIPGHTLAGLPVVAPADAWSQLAVRGSTGLDEWERRTRNLTHEWLVATADFVLTGPRIDGRRVPLATPADLAEAVRRRRGKRGVVELTLALDRARPGAQSPRETFLRIGLVDCGLPEPDVQVPVRTAAGLRHADLGYPDAKVLLEYQGDHHRTDRRQWLDDLTRFQLFQDAGYHVIPVGAADIRPDCSALAARVRRALSR